MNILQFVFRKFEKETTTVETVEAWIVEWSSISGQSALYARYNQQHKVFLSKKHAEAFKDELETCRKLLGDCIPEPKVYKQDSPTNI